jgi:hypothetical protein
MNIIDAFLVTLGLDSSAFKKGSKDIDKSLKDTKDGANRTAKDMEASGKVAAEFFGKLRNQFIALELALTAGKGAKSFVKDVTQSDAAIGRAAKNIGVSTEELSKWQNMAGQLGGAASDVTQTMSGLSQAFQDMFLKGLPNDGIAWLNSMGVNLEKFVDQRGNVKDMTGLMMAMSKALNSKGVTAAEAQALGRQIGATEGMVNVLRHSSGELQHYYETVRFTTQAEAEAAMKREAEYNRMMQSTTDLGRKLMMMLQPSIESVLKGLIALADWLGKHPTLFATFAGIVAAAAATLTVALNVLAFKGFLGLVGAMFKVPAAAAAAGAGMEAAAVKAAAANATMTASLGGLLKMLGQVALVGYIAHEALKNLDPNDDFGSWMDEHSGIASWLDNAASKIGLGRSYEEQRQNTERRRQESKARGEPDQIPQTPAERRLSGRPAAKVTPQQREQAEYDIAKLVGMGWTRAQAAGIAANIQAESKGDHKAVGDSGQAYGLAQWHRDRQEAFKKWMGKDIRESSRDEQLAFINYELREGSERKAGLNLMRARDAGSAGDIVSRMYERPANTEGDAAKRSGIALSLLQPGPQIDPALQVGAAGAVASTTNNHSTSSNHSETSVHIENVNLPNATDAESTAKGLGPSLQRYFDLTAQANYGIS